MNEEDAQKLADMDLTEFIKHEKDLFIVLGIFAALALYIPQWAQNLGGKESFNITPQNYGLMLEPLNILDLGMAASLLIVIVLFLLILNGLLETGNKPVYSIFIGSKSLLKLLFSLILFVIIGFLLFIMYNFNKGVLIDLFALILVYLGVWIIFSSYSWFIEICKDRVIGSIIATFFNIGICIESIVILILAPLLPIKIWAFTFFSSYPLSLFAFCIGLIIEKIRNPR